MGLLIPPAVQCVEPKLVRQMGQMTNKMFKMTREVVKSLCGCDLSQTFSTLLRCSEMFHFRLHLGSWKSDTSEERSASAARIFALRAATKGYTSESKHSKGKAHSITKITKQQRESKGNAKEMQRRAGAKASNPKQGVYKRSCR